jgi:hypothetical protein
MSAALRDPGGVFPNFSLKTGAGRTTGISRPGLPLIFPAEIKLAAGMNTQRGELAGNSYVFSLVDIGS